MWKEENRTIYVYIGRDSEYIYIRTTEIYNSLCLIFIFKSFFFLCRESFYWLDTFF